MQSGRGWALQAKKNVMSKGKMEKGSIKYS
jgi:hypothetical protein